MSLWNKTDKKPAGDAFTSNVNAEIIAVENVGWVQRKSFGTRVQDTVIVPISNMQAAVTDYDPAALSFFGAAPDNISNQDKAAYNNFFIALRDADMLNDFDILLALRTNGEQNSLIDLLAGPFTFAKDGSGDEPVFVSRIGYDNAGKVPPSLLTTNFSGITKFSQDDAHIGFYRNNPDVDLGINGVYTIAFDSGGTNATIVYKTADNPQLAWITLNSAGGDVGSMTLNIDGKKHIVLDRPDSGNIDGFGDGALIQSFVNTSSGVTKGAALEFMGSTTTNTGSQGSFSFFHVGRSLGPTKIAALTAAIETYIAAVHP